MWWALMLAQAVSAAPAEEAQACEAEPAQVLIGERYRRHVPTRAKQLSGATKVRVLFPGQAATDEFRPERVDLRVDYDRRIADVTCG